MLNFPGNTLQNVRRVEHSATGPVSGGFSQVSQDIPQSIEHYWASRAANELRCLRRGEELIYRGNLAQHIAAVLNTRSSFAGRGHDDGISA